MAPLDASKAASPPAVEAFIIRWDGTAMAERTNAQLFLAELCDVLAVPRSDSAASGIGLYPSSVTQPS